MTDKKKIDDSKLEEVAGGNVDIQVVSQTDVYRDNSHGDITDSSSLSKNRPGSSGSGSATDIDVDRTSGK